MKYGTIFPTCEIGTDPIAIRDFAQAAEALGYSRITAYDHVLGASHEDREPALRGPYSERDAFHEPLVLFGFLAAHTSTIELATGVLVLPQRQVALVAKQATEVDLLSNGRLVLGLGIGWNHVEYAALGTEFANRARRFDEQIDVLRALWRDDLVAFHGKYHRVDRAGLSPRPARVIPIWFGGSADAAIDRAARVGDGFVFNRSGPPTLALAGTLHDKLVAYGRTASGFGLDAFVDFGAGPDGWRPIAASWAAAGGTMLTIRTMSTTSAIMNVSAPRFTTVDQHIGALEQFIGAVKD